MFTSIQTRTEDHATIVLMRRLILLLVLSFLALLTPSPVFAQSSPHLILNFAQINELPWSAPEEQWQREVKPKVVEEVREMREILQLLKRRMTSK